MTLSNPTVGLAAHTGQTDIRITAKAPDEATADRMIAEIEAQVRARVGQFIYGVEKQAIEEALVQSLQERHLKVAISETGIDNRLNERLAGVPGGMDVLAGVEQFPDEQTLCQSLGVNATASQEEIGQRAARHACETFHAPLGIAVVTHQGGTSVTVLTPEGVLGRFYRFDDGSTPLPIWASTWGMALAWRWLHERQTVTG